MICKREYVEYLLSTPFNYTCTHMADHKPDVSHDQVNRDSVQDKRYARFIELAKRQYSGNIHGTVNGIGLVNLVHSTGNDGEFYPIDYRIYHPDTDGKTKNEHFQAMFERVITYKSLKVRTILFDSWYASVENLKLIHQAVALHHPARRPLKSNRLVSLSKETGYQHLQEMIWTASQEISGQTVKLKEMPFLVKLFRLVAPNGDTEWLITNDLKAQTNRFVAENKNAVNSPDRSGASAVRLKLSVTT